VVPGCALPLAFAATSWPLYLANYADLPDTLSWAAAVFGSALAVGAVLVATRFAQIVHAARVRPLPVSYTAATPASVPA
jgi:hypothetical protein